MVQQLPWVDLCKQVFLILYFNYPRFVDRVEDQRTCFELPLGEQLVVVHKRFSRDLFLPDNDSFVVVRDRRVVDRWSCGAMEVQVSLVSRFILARRPHGPDEIVVAVFLIVRSEEENGGDNGSDIYEVGVGWLDVFDLVVFLSCFKERGNLFRQNGVQSGLLAW